VEVLSHYRDHKNYLLYEFVLMPDHFHLLISPMLSLERSLPLIKGGFSCRAKKEVGFGPYVRQNPRSRIIPTVQPGRNLPWTRYLSG
jgi:REP element-mobilizing transposase RayT